MWKAIALFTFIGFARPGLLCSIVYDHGGHQYVRCPKIEEKEESCNAFRQCSLKLFFCLF